MPRHSQQTIQRAQQLYLAGLACEDIAQTLHIGRAAVFRWAKQGEWKERREVTAKLDGRTPMQVQEDLERVAGQELTKLMRLPEPEPEMLARWQDISSKCRANIRGILEQATDPEIYCRWLDMFCRFLGQDDVRKEQGEQLAPVLRDFEAAIRSGKITPT